MWELNENLNVKSYEIQGSTIYIVDNIYKYPDKVGRYLFNRNDVPLWKNDNTSQSRNGKDFDDRRYLEPKEIPIHAYLEQLCGQKLSDRGLITNQTRFLQNQYNQKYKDHYWWAHTDSGYNGIIYFNHDSINGTNLYYQNCPLPNENEHVDPWTSKKNMVLLHYLEPKFNRLVLFNGKKFLHGMAINDDRYHCKRFVNAPWNTYRCNQVFFLCGN
tara:strand:- start:107 stop:751 length:645 start_codon:yes stop_codon:yes gene_type:complete